MTENDPGPAEGEVFRLEAPGNEATVQVDGFGRAALEAELFGGQSSLGPHVVAQTNAQWATPDSGNWHEASRWNPQVVPNADDVSATINAAGPSYTISFDQDATVDRLTLNSPDAKLVHTAGELTLDRLEINSGAFEFVPRGDASVLEANEIVVSGGEFLIQTDPNQGRIRGATIVSDAPLQMGSVRLENVTLGSDVTTIGPDVVTIDGNLGVANGATITLEDTLFVGQTDRATLTGNGQLVLQGGELQFARGVIEPGVTIQVPENSRDNFVRMDRLEGQVNVAEGGTLRITSFQFANQGRINADGYVFIDAGGDPLENLGAIRVGPSGILQIYSTVRLSDLALIEDQTETGFIFFGGRLELDGETLDLDALQFRQTALFQRIVGGRIQGTQPAYELVRNNHHIFLEDVTLAANLAGDQRFTINGDLEMDHASIELSVNGILNFHSDDLADQVLMGQGTVRLLDDSRIVGRNAIIGPDIQLELVGNSHRVEVLRNNGTIHASTASDVYVGINQGTIVLNGQPDDTFRYGKESNNTWANQGTLRLEQGELELTGSYTAASLGNLEQVGGHLRYSGVYDNQGQVLELGDDRSLHGELLAGKLVATAGQVASISGVFRGDTTLQGHFDVGALRARNLILENTTLLISGNVATEGLEGTGHIALNGGRFEMTNRSEFVVTPELSLEVKRGARSDLFIPVVNQTTLTLEPEAGLGVPSLLNRGVVEIREAARLISFDAIDQPADASGRWLIGRHGTLEGGADIKLGTHDHTTIQLGIAADHVVPLRAKGTFTQAGTLEVVANALPVRTGQTFQLIDATEIAGQFDEVILPRVLEPFSWDHSLLETNGTLTVAGPEAEFIAGTQFNSATVGSDSYVPSPGSLELGFTSTSRRAGVNPALQIEIDPDTSLNRLTHRSVLGITEFDAVDVGDFREVEVAFQLSIDPTGYETGDFVELSAHFAGENVSVLLDGTDLREAGGNGIQTYTMLLPNRWQNATVVMTTQSNSSQGSEAYSLHALTLTGFRRDLFVEQGDFNNNGVLDADDIDQLTRAIIEQSSDERFNYGHDDLNQHDRDYWVESVASTSYGDSNLDGWFDSSDLVAVFVAGEYEDDIEGNSGWASGDWNGDLEFDTNDLVWVFQQGDYRDGATGARAVPEPLETFLPCVFLATLFARRKLLTRPNRRESR